MGLRHGLCFVVELSTSRHTPSHHQGYVIQALFVSPRGTFSTAALLLYRRGPPASQIGCCTASPALLHGRGAGRLPWSSLPRPCTSPFQSCRPPSLPGHTPPAPRLHVPCWTHRSLPAPGLHPPCWTQCRVLPYGGPHLRRIHTQRPVHGESSLMLCWVVTGREGTARTCPQAVGTKVQNTHIHSLHHPGRLASSSAAASGACLPRCWWQPSCWTRRRPASWGCTRSWARVSRQRTGHALPSLNQS